MPRSPRKKQSQSSLPFRFDMWQEAAKMEGHEPWINVKWRQGELDVVQPGAMFIVNSRKTKRGCVVLTLTQVTLPVVKS